MHINRIKIHRIRLIDDTELDFQNSNLVVYIGLNNSGKTSILRAIEFFFSNEKKFEDLYPKNGNGSYCCKEDDNPSVIIDFVMNEEEKNFFLKNLEESKHKVKVEESIYKTDLEEYPYGISIKRELLWKGDKVSLSYHLIKDINGNYQNITGYSNRICPLLPKYFYLPSVASVDDYQNASTKAKNNFEDLFQIYIEGLRFEDDEEIKTVVEELVKKIKKKLNYEETQDELYDFSAKVLEEIKKIEIKPQFKGVSDLSSVLKKVDIDVNDGILTPLSDKGSGTQRAVIIALLQLIGKVANKKNNKESILLLDEPEIHLHPKAQKALRNSIEEIARQHKVIVATHSHLMIGKRKADSLIKRVCKNGDKVNIIDICEKEHIKELFSLIGFIPSDFLMPDNLLLVEGKWDKRYIQSIIELLECSKCYNFDKILADYDYSIIPLGGEGRKVSRAIQFLKEPEEAIDFLSSLPCYSEKFCGIFDVKDSNWVKNQRQKINDEKDGKRINVLTENGIEYYYPHSLIEKFGKEDDIYKNSENEDVVSYLARFLSDKEQKSGFKKQLATFVNLEINDSHIQEIDKDLLTWIKDFINLMPA